LVPLLAVSAFLVLLLRLSPMSGFVLPAAVLPCGIVSTLLLLPIACTHVLSPIPAEESRRFAHPQD
jgi:hypothetical protein